MKLQNKVAVITGGSSGIFRGLYRSYSLAATTQEVLTHHLDTLGKGDLAGVMAD